MFYLKKIITSFILPPGLLILFFLALTLILIYKKKNSFAAMILFFSLFLWLISIEPLSRSLIYNLEKPFRIEKNYSCDVIILLGGGIYELSEDITGQGFPLGDMLARIVTAVRIQKKLQVPIIVSFGNAFEEKNSNAAITKRLLTDLGVQSKDIIIEDKSRDTYENAVFTKKILIKNNFDTPLLITSGYHLKRAQYIFRKIGIDTKELPAYRMTGKNITYHWNDYLPRAHNLYNLSLALHEYIGLWYYKFVYRNV